MAVAKIKKFYKKRNDYADAIKFIQTREQYVQKLMKKLDIPSEFECKMKAEEIINICIYERQNVMYKINCILKNIKTKLVLIYIDQTVLQNAMI